MTKTASIVLSFSLLVNEITLLNRGNILTDQYFASNLVFLQTVCLILRRIDIIPKAFWRKSSSICLVLEILITLVLLESSVVYIWKHIQDCILQNADSLLVLLVEQYNLDWLVCHLCCGKSDCPMIFAALLLKALSLIGLVFVCIVFT